MASYAQKALARPNEVLIPVYLNDQPTTAAATSIAITIIRGVTAALFVTIISLCSFPGIIFSILHLQSPTVQLNWLSISNLNASDAQISAQWEANITATNPDKRFTVVLEAAKIAVYYKGFNSSLSEFSTKNVTLNRSKSVAINATGGIGKDVLVDDKSSLPFKEMANAQKSGKMSFEVEIKVVAIQMAFSLWDNRVGMRFSCRDIPVDLVSGGGGAGKALFSRGSVCTLLPTQ